MLSIIFEIADNMRIKNWNEQSVLTNSKHGKSCIYTDL